MKLSKRHNLSVGYVLPHADSVEETLLGHTLTIQDSLLLLILSVFRSSIHNVRRHVCFDSRQVDRRSLRKCGNLARRHHAIVALNRAGSGTRILLVVSLPWLGLDLCRTDGRLLLLDGSTLFLALLFEETITFHGRLSLRVLLSITAQALSSNAERLPGGSHWVDLRRNADRYLRHGPLNIVLDQGSLFGANLGFSGTLLHALLSNCIACVAAVLLAELVEGCADLVSELGFQASCETILVIVV